MSVTEEGVTLFRETQQGKASYVRKPSPLLVEELEGLLDSFCSRTQAKAMRLLGEAVGCEREPDRKL